MEVGKQLEYGVQPLDGMMERIGLSNHDLVVASEEGLTHKQVGRARRGRRMKRNMQEKVVRAFNGVVQNGEEAVEYTVRDIFNYRG
ncbi:MAG: hypothetical protein AAGD22_16510 [Verrucomicrobiota bacterium]